MPTWEFRSAGQLSFKLSSTGLGSMLGLCHCPRSCSQMHPASASRKRTWRHTYSPKIFSQNWHRSLPPSWIKSGCHTNYNVDYRMYSLCRPRGRSNGVQLKSKCLIDTWKRCITSYKIYGMINVLIVENKTWNVENTYGNLVAIN